MSDLQKDQFDLLLSLINESNPDLDTRQLTLENVRFSTPKSYNAAPGEIVDTEVDIHPLDDTFFIGKQTVYYRRIDLDALLKDIIVEIPYRIWNPTEGVETSLGTKEFHDYLLENYRVNIPPTDIYPGDWNLSTRINGSYRQTVSSTSYCYQGGITLRHAPYYYHFPYQIDTLITPDTSKVSEWYLNQTEDLDKPSLTTLASGVDFNRHLSAWSLSSGSTVEQNRVLLESLLRDLNDVMGTSLSIDIPHTEVNGLGGLRVHRYHSSANPVQLENVNTEAFEAAVVIESLPDSWFSGRLVMPVNRLMAILSNRFVHNIAVNPKLIVKNLYLPVDVDITLTVTAGEVEDLPEGAYTWTTHVSTGITEVEMPITLKAKDIGTTEYKVVLTSPYNTSPAVMGNITQSMVVAPRNTHPKYGETVVFDIDYAQFQPEVEYTYRVAPLEGSFREPVTGTFTPSTIEDTLDIPIPQSLARVYDTTFVVELLESDVVVVTSRKVKMNDLQGVTTTFYDYNWSPIPGVTYATIEIAGAGGGGGGLRRYRTGEGGDGGNGDLIVRHFSDLTPDDWFKLSPGVGGVAAGRYTSDNGGAGERTRVHRNGAIVGTAEGGGGGKGTIANYHGDDGADAGNGQGGKGGRGSYPTTSNGSYVSYPQRGSRGRVTITWASWLPEADDVTE